MKTTRKLLAAILAMVMVLCILPLTVSAAENVYVLDAKEHLEPMEKGTKADGDTAVVGQDGYFTIHFSGNTAIDESSKEFADGYTSNQRLNFAGKAQVKPNGTTKNVVEFTTEGPAVVKVWWVQAGEDNRQMGIFDAEGELVTQTEGTWEKNQPYFSTLEIAEAGKYFLGGVENKNYIFRIEVVVTAADAPQEPTVATVEDGKYVIACGDLTFAALAEDKGYGYPVAGSASALTDADYVTITNVADGQFTMQDCFGRYIYMKGSYNSFNVSAEMPTEGYLWVLEETEGGLMLKNVEKEKYLAYSEQYSSWGCYAEVTANFVLTVTAAVTEEPAKELTALLKFADADFYPATAGVCPTVITGPGTYTLSIENITATFGCGLDMAYMLYIEVADGYEALKDMVISDVKVVVDGEEIAVNQDFVWTYESLNTEFLPTGAYCIELYNALGYSGAGYGAAIDPNIFADESIVITFTMTDPNASVEPEPGPDDNQPTGDAIFAVLAIFAASGMGLTAVVSKKR